MVRLPRVTLDDKPAARVGRGHLWVFSNDVKSQEEGIQPGSEVAVFGKGDDFLGCALFNRHALIAGRIYSHRSEAFDGAFLRSRLEAALARRRRLLPGRTALRLVFSEADQLPGLIVDQYSACLVVQFLTLAMDQRRAEVLEALQQLLSPQAIVDRSDVSVRENEGLAETKGVLSGTLPDDFLVDVGGISMRADLLNGQKTGLFLDQVENWALAAQYAKGRKVLDLFSNTGGFSLHAARAGAESVKAVDSSELALSHVMFNAQRNGLADRIRAKRADAFLYTRSQPEQYDLIICDPPAFAKSRKQLETALRGYRELNRQCIKMLAPGGILLSASCSAAVSQDDFDHMLVLSARDAGRSLRLLPGGGQPADHAPVLAMAESRYLKVRLVEAD